MDNEEYHPEVDNVKAYAFKMVYLAVPYTHPLENVRELRFEIINRVSGSLFSYGIFNFSPITHSHVVAEAMKVDGLATTTKWDFWAEYDCYMISLCDALWVVCLDGWKRSVGVTAEIIYAQENNIPIKYLDVHLNMERNTLQLICRDDSTVFLETKVAPIPGHLQSLIKESRDAIY